MPTLPSSTLPPPIPPGPPYQQPLHPPPLLSSTAWAPSALRYMDAARSSSPSSNNPPPVQWHYGDMDDHNFQAHGRSMVLVIVIFSVVLFLALLCLYARWACRYRRMVITVSSSSVDGVDVGSGGVYAVAVGLEREEIDGIPVILFQKVPEETVGGRRKEEVGVRCSICLSTFGEGDKVKVLPGCGHMFHPECVDEWLRSQPTCPLCRSKLGGVVADGDDHDRQLGDDAV